MENSLVNPIVLYLESQTKLIADLSPTVLRAPTGRSLHEFRLAMRRTRTALWCLRYSSIHLHSKPVDRKLRIIGKALGSVRELDVAIADSKYYRLEGGTLLTQKTIAQRNLRKLIAYQKIKTLKKQLLQIQNATRFHAQIGMNRTCSKLEKRLTHQLIHPVAGNSDLHKLRIVLKKTQYSFEAMNLTTAPVKRLQVVLGNAHDLQFLQTSIGSVRSLALEQRALNRRSSRMAMPVLRFALRELRKRWLA